MRLDGHSYTPALLERIVTLAGRLSSFEQGRRLGTRQAGAGPGAHQPQAKEDKSACLVGVRGDVHAADPQPEPPAVFRDARRVARLVRQFQSQGPPADEAAAADAPPAADAADRPGKPEQLLRTGSGWTTPVIGGRVCR